MTERHTFFRLILPFALFVVPYLLYANGEPVNGNPLNGGPDNPEAIDSKLGHCNPIVLPVINCVTHTIELSAFVNWAFTGVLEPFVANWNTGQVAHKITVVPPGAWSWDPSVTTCEQSHWANEYNQPGTFFLGNIDITSTGAICSGGSVLLNVDVDNYPFTTYLWSPENPTGALSPFEAFEPGVYSLELRDELNCPFMEQINLPLSPPLNPSASGPPFMCPEGDTANIQVNQVWTSYAWSTGDTSKIIQILEPGGYNVTVTNQFGCTGETTVGIQSGAVNAVPISMTAQKICVGDRDTLRVVGGFVSYLWSNGVSNITNIVTQPGTYAVTVTNAYGCTARIV